MEFIYYFGTCPTCKNYERNIVREALLRAKTLLSNPPVVIERYIAILPDVWGEEVKNIQKSKDVSIPFLLNTKTGATLHIDHTNPTMKEDTYTFLASEE